MMGFLPERVALVGNQLTVKQGFRTDKFLLCFSLLGDYYLFYQRCTDHRLPVKCFTGEGRRKESSKMEEL